MRPTRLRGARTHNLQGVDLDLEPGSLVAIAGVSGAGKSSLAFGTLYAEGQRRYVESFSAYARQFLERLARPPVDELDPVPAGIAVDRQAPVRTSRSTVGTMTEITDYAKVLWARAATPSCPGCGRRVERDTPASAAAAIIDADPGARVVVTYPVAVDDTEGLLAARERLLGEGYRRVWSGGRTRDIDDVAPDEAAGGLDVIADRTVASEGRRARLVESIEAAMRRGSGRVDVHVAGGDRHRFSGQLACAHCGVRIRRATPGLFSFNNPIGACDHCRGFGRTIGIDWDKVLPDPSLSLRGGAVRPWQGKKTTWERRQMLRHARRVGIDVDAPIAELTPEQRAWLIEGEGGHWRSSWFGLRGWFDWLETKVYKMHVRVLLSRYRRYDVCDACGGTRLVPEASSWRVGGLTIPELYGLPVDRALAFVREQKAQHEGDPATSLLLRECEGRLGILVDVGLGYLSLDRASRTLSGGETQRVALTGALGASLSGAMFVLDEPTVGLHPCDVGRLVGVVQRLARGDNVAVLVEHDPDVLRAADRVVEIGPAAGERGGRIVFDGTPAELRRAGTATGRALSARPRVRRERRDPAGWLSLRGARGHNLRGIDVDVPLGVVTCVTGVSGSGKSTLVRETLGRAVGRALGQRGEAPLPHDRLDGADQLAGIIQVDQAPLGRTSRGNPATYLKAWDVIRKRFTATRLAKERGYKPGFFSFNVPGGRCESCKGEGAETVEMQFLADVIFECPECKGRRFVGEVLDVRHRGLDIAAVLELTAREALERLAPDRELERRLEPMVAVGLGYLRLGQPLNTLSGGEAQRLKLASALSGAEAGTLLVLDEPTAGLHADDVTPLLDVLDQLADRGDTVIVVEHDMRLAAHADHVIDLGPGAGADGGDLVAAGSPEQVAGTDSVTAPFLARALGRKVGSGAAARKPARRRRRAGRAEGIVVTGAREHNLRDVTVEIPREKLVVVTGPSGSGKSTLAFDCLYAEGQRRYLETLSPYARQYMPQLPRPAVDRVTGVPPSVSLEQRTTRGGSNSTVATVTEVAHYLRLLYARAGLLHCPDCEVPIAARPPALLAEDLVARFSARRRLTLMAPVVRGRKGHYRELFETAHQGGFRRARVDGRVRDIVPGMKLDRYREHDVELVVGEVRAGDDGLEDMVREAVELGEGVVHVIAGKTDLLLSSRRACPECGQGFPELDPRFFSFNTRHGACDECEGRGHVVVEVGRGRNAREERHECDECEGTRLSPLARSVTLDGRPITDILSCSVADARDVVAGLRFHGRDAVVAEAPLAEAERLLAFLDEVGVGYLDLDRPADSLSGGELQRVRLAAQLGSGLTGVLYVLDEPTIGLHPRDTGRMLRALRALVDRGNSVLVVEHDADTIRAADLVVDIGPGGGRHGGAIVAMEAPDALADDPRSVTGPALARPAPVPAARRPVDRDTPRLSVVGAREHNLRDVRLDIPLGRLGVVTGVSGSGKSTLVREVLLRATREALDLVTDPPGEHDRVLGAEELRSAIEIDQSPIGRTPRSVPATYVGIWDHIRRLLAGTPEARARGFTASRFSFNVADGRCPGCEGQGALRVEMSFLPDVLVPCEICDGARFSADTLDVTWHGLDAGQILDLDVEAAAELFDSIPRVRKPLRLLADLGLGYLKLGQPSNTLSGGEAQRLKLVSELATSRTGGTLYVMDEPTTGLHRDDVERLLRVLHRLVDRGDTVVVIEHQPDLILSADWVVDLGPEGGAGGGTIVAEGTPEAIAARKRSHTGAVLARELRASR